MEALLKAKPDSTIELPEGKFQLDASLSLSVNNVKIKGQGMDKTILSFKGQSSGAEGLLVTADGFSIEDLSIEDTKGDALKIKAETELQSGEFELLGQVDQMKKWGLRYLSCSM